MNTKMRFKRDVFEEIKRTVGIKRVETGGILLGDRNDYIVKKFIFDSKGSTSHAAYDPDINFLNKCIKEEWENNNLALLGFVHSHPRGVSRLSGDWGNNTGDIGYIKAIFSAIPALDRFLVPIIYSSHDGGEFNMFPYMAERGNESNYRKLELYIDDYGVEISYDDYHSKYAKEKKWLDNLENKVDKNDGERF
jgi:hypothetical protein